MANSTAHSLNLMNQTIAKTPTKKWTPADSAFLLLFVFRYLRLVVNLIAFWLWYHPCPIPDNPSYSSQDCTIIIPTVEPDNKDFLECITSVLKNNPGAIWIVTVGQNNLEKVRQVIHPLAEEYPNTRILPSVSEIANKRHQVAHAVPKVVTPITVLIDDHIFWPSANFLRTILAPFEDSEVGAVGTNKRVRRFNNGFGLESFWNMIGALYLERHNFEIRATNAIDGGVFVLSGRTSAHRTSILRNPAFLPAFKNERFFFGLFGPLNADDDNFITRWEVNHGWKLKIQYCEDALIETTLGTYPKFLSQCLRWVRTTWRSNSASLFTDRTVWFAQPWCVYAVYLTSFVNFALFYDSALLLVLSKTTYGHGSTTAFVLLGVWIFMSKMVKLTPYFLRHPQDLVYLPGYLIFAYYHSLIMLYAGLTFWVTTWSGRDLSATEGAAGANAQG